MTIPTYSTGTVSVAANGTVVTGSGGPLWLSNVKPGDWISIDQTDLVMVIDVTADNKITILPWKGGAKTNVAYVVVENYSARDDSGEIAKSVGLLVAAQNVEGFIWYVPSTRTVPDPSRGDEGQWAYQPSTGMQWVKQGGLWAFVGTYGPLRATGGWLITTAYKVNDIATLNGTSYICKVAHTGQQPPNGTYWQTNAAKGDTGPTPFRPLVNWSPAVAYGIGPPADYVAFNGSSYVCLVTHTSTASFSNDLAAGNWRLVAAQGPTGLATYQEPQLRLTLTSGTPVMQTSVAGAGVHVYTPYAGDLVPLYDGTKMVATQFPETFQAVTDATKSPAAVVPNAIYDVFAWKDGGGTCWCTRGPAWASSSSRGYTLSFVSGFLLNTSAITNGPAALRGTYVGTIATNAAGTFDFIFGGSAPNGIAGVFNVWNAYNPVDVGCTVVDTSGTYTYTAFTPRQAHGSASMQVSFVVGLSRDALDCSYQNVVSTADVVNPFVRIGIGYDDTTTFAAINYFQARNNTGAPFTRLVNRPAIGRHTVYALESSDSTNANTFGTLQIDGLSFKFRM